LLFLTSEGKLSLWVEGRITVLEELPK
jgi:hypothetical protein